VNLPLHLGWPGVFEAGLIAFVLGLAAFWLLHRAARRWHWSRGHAIGWSAVLSVAAAAGIDGWNLFYLGVVNLESPLRAKIVLAAIHDADNLARRVVLELIGALIGVVLGWMGWGRIRRE